MSVNVALLIGFVVVMFVTRRAAVIAWRTGRLSHRQAALVLAGPVPLLLFGLGVASGSWALMAGAAFAGIGSYAFGEFLMRYMGGEFDPPSSRSYEKRDL